MLTPFEEELFVGSRFADRYQILSVVGRGSMGVVYKARHELMGRLVAIKMLRGQLALDERSVKRFEREARAASRMDHPNVIAVHDFGLTEHRQPYLVMDFASGVTLYEIQKKDRILGVERAVHIFSQVCDALHHAHLQGVIHRDLKPSNIMVVAKEDDPNFVKVFDLGVAKIAWGDEEEKEAITQTGEVCGSPVYLSPEQCTHDVTDHRTDIYSLGVVMYELLTGFPPLMGETVYDTIYLHVHEQPPKFAEVTDDVIPSRLEKIVLKALSKNPDERHQSMQELKWDLQASMMQSDPILRVMPPHELSVARKRPPSEAPTGREPENKRSRIAQTPAQTSMRMAKYNGTASSRELAKMPGEEQTTALAQIRERLRQVNPVIIAVASSVLSIAITLGVVAMINSGTKQTPATAPSPAPTTATPTVETPPAHIDAPHLVPTHGVRPAALNVRPSHKAVPLNSTATAVVAPKVEHPPRVEPQIKVEPQPKVGRQSQPEPAPEPPSNPFFSIFAPGKSVKSVAPASPPQAISRRPSQQAPVRQSSSQQLPGTQPPGMQPPAIPQQVAPMPTGPAEEDVRQSRILNNEAVATLTQDPQNAIGKLQRALKLDPTYVRAKQNLGRAFHNLANRQRAAGDTFAAVNSYRQSLNILTDVLGAKHPDTQLTKQDYENLLQTAGIAN